MAKYRISLTLSADVDVSDREKAEAMLDATVEGTANNWAVMADTPPDDVKTERVVAKVGD